MQLPLWDFAYALWLGITKILDEDKPVKEEHKKY